MVDLLSLAFPNLKLSYVFKDVFIYFDSWNDLKNKIKTLDFSKQKNILKEIGKKHEKDMLEKWKNVLNINILDFKYNYY